MHIVILSYRISGNDGVSLECAHWREILTRMGHKVTFLAGQLDRDGVLMPELHFQVPKVIKIHDKVVYDRGKYREVESEIFSVAGTIEGKLRRFFGNSRKIDLLIVANVLSLPMHFPLAVALTRVIEDFNIPTIARHHDFWWERKRYLKSNLFPFFERFFPPQIFLIKHTVINTLAQEEFKRRTGGDAAVIGDSFDFSSRRLARIGAYSAHFRRDFGLEKSDRVFLQATRIVPRKRFELSVKFMERLADPRAVLVICGRAGDEGVKYLKKIKNLCRAAKIRFRIVSDFVASKRKMVEVAGEGGFQRRRVYNLWDCYRNADFVLYPTSFEGFGNQFIEATYFKKPIIMTPYSVFTKDIEPLGFEVIKLTKAVNKKVIDEVKFLMKNKTAVSEMVEKNFDLGASHFSYEATSEKIRKLIL